MASMIPEKIVEYDGETSFFNDKTITGFRMKPGVKTMGQDHFANCSNLRSIKGLIGSDVTEIGRSVFSNCISIESLEGLPPTVHTMGKWCFYNCAAMTSLFFLEGIPDLPKDCVVAEDSFDDCATLSTEAGQSGSAVVEEFLRDSSDSPEFHRMCSNPAGTLEALRLLPPLQDPNKMGEIPLHFAARNRNPNLANDFISYCLKFDEDGKESCATVRSKNNVSPLHAACSNRTITRASLRLLIDACPEALHEKNRKSQMPLHVADAFNLPQDIQTFLFSCHPLNEPCFENNAQQYILLLKDPSTDMKTLPQTGWGKYIISIFFFRFCFAL